MDAYLMDTYNALIVQTLAPLDGARNQLSQINQDLMPESWGLSEVQRNPFLKSVVWPMQCIKALLWFTSKGGPDWPGWIRPCCSGHIRKLGVFLQVVTDSSDVLAAHRVPQQIHSFLMEATAVITNGRKSSPFGQWMKPSILSAAEAKEDIRVHALLRKTWEMDSPRLRIVRLCPNPRGGSCTCPL